MGRRHCSQTGMQAKKQTARNIQADGKCCEGGRVREREGETDEKADRCHETRVREAIRQAGGIESRQKI